jgi:hypothetical protein
VSRLFGALLTAVVSVVRGVGLGVAPVVGGGVRKVGHSAA